MLCGTITLSSVWGTLHVANRNTVIPRIYWCFMNHAAKNGMATVSLCISMLVRMCVSVHLCVVENNRDEKVSVWLHSRFRKSNGWTVGNEADNRDSARPRRFEGQTEKGGAAEGMTKGGGNYWISQTVIAERYEYNVDMYWEKGGLWPKI